MGFSKYWHRNLASQMCGISDSDVEEYRKQLEDAFTAGESSAKSRINPALALAYQVACQVVQVYEPMLLDLDEESILLYDRCKEIMDMCAKVGLNAKETLRKSVQDEIAGSDAG